MIGAANLNVSAPVADQILTFLGILEAAKDPKSVKAFFAQLAEERAKNLDAELAAIAARKDLAAARDEAQVILDKVPEAQAMRDTVLADCQSEHQKLSDTRADLERREQELTASRAELKADAKAQSAKLAKDQAQLAASWATYNLACDALSGEQAQHDLAVAEVDALRAQYEDKIAKLRAAVGDQA